MSDLVMFKIFFLFICFPFGAKLLYKTVCFSLSQFVFLYVYLFLELVCSGLFSFLLITLLKHFLQYNFRKKILWYRIFHIDMNVTLINKGLFIFIQNCQFLHVLGKAEKCPLRAINYHYLNQASLTTG